MRNGSCCIATLALWDSEALCVGSTWQFGPYNYRSRFPICKNALLITTGHIKPFLSAILCCLLLDVDTVTSSCLSDSIALHIGVKKL